VVQGNQVLGRKGGVRRSAHANRTHGPGETPAARGYFRDRTPIVSSDPRLAPTSLGMGGWGV
jgi:hypothetical protein